MTDTIEDHEGTVSTRRQSSHQSQLAKLSIERFGKASTAYSMEISAEKTKLMTKTVASTHRSK